MHQVESAGISHFGGSLIFLVQLSFTPSLGFPFWIFAIDVAFRCRLNGIVFVFVYLETLRAGPPRQISSRALIVHTLTLKCSQRRSITSRPSLRRPSLRCRSSPQYWDARRSGTGSTLLPVSGKSEHLPQTLQTNQADSTRYLLNYPLALIVFSAINILATNRYLSRSPSPRLSAQSLVSPTSDSDLAKLESDVILSAVAGNLLPPHKKDDGLDKPLPSKEVGKVVEDYKEEAVDVRRWERVGWIVRIVGGVVYLGIEVARAVVDREWKGVAFPVDPLPKAFKESLT